MNFSDIKMVIDRGKNEAKVEKIKDQLTGVSGFVIPIEERLEIVLELAEFNGPILTFAKTSDRKYDFILGCKNEYLAGLLGDIDDEVAEKLRSNRTQWLAAKRLKIVLGLAEFKGSLRAFAKTTDRSYSVIYVSKREYLAGHLGEVDKVIVEKLKRGK